MDEDDYKPRPQSGFSAHKLDNLSVHELKDYIKDLESEIERATSEITKKQKT